jgi:hypothetical protein
MALRARRRSSIVLFLLLALGMLFWWLARGLSTNQPPPLLIAGAAGGFSLLSGVAPRMMRIFERLRTQPTRHPILAPLLIAIAAVVVLLTAAVARQRPMVPLIYDEYSYLLQTRVLSAGRLWLPAHALAPFFESFFILVRPVYCSIYFPGTAIANVPGMWLNLPSWAMPLLIAGATAGLLFHIVAQLCDGAAALLAVLLLLSLATFRGMSIMVMSHPAALLLCEAMIAVTIHWRRDNGSSPWSPLLIGVFAGWAAITRPAEAFAFVVPVGVLMLLQLRTKPLRRWLLAALLVLCGAAPFLATQAIFDRGVTGRWLQTPYTYYTDREQPQTQFAIHPAALDPNAHPASGLQEVREHYFQFLRPNVEQYRRAGAFGSWLGDRGRTLVQAVLPHPALLMLLPVGLLGLNSNPGRWLLLVAAALLLLLYSFQPILLEWYTLAWFPAVILLSVLGVDALATRVAPQGPAIGCAAWLAVAALAISSLFFAPPGGAENLDSRIISSIHDYEANSNIGRAVLLFRFSPDANFRVDPVYTIGAANPDDARWIHARDLGFERDRELVSYFARHQPDRRIITIDLGTGATTDWGPADQALARWPHNQ